MAKRSRKYIKNQQLVKAAKAEPFVPLALVEGEKQFAEAGHHAVPAGTMLLRHFIPMVCGAQVKRNGYPLFLEWYEHTQFTCEQEAAATREKPWVLVSTEYQTEAILYFATKTEAVNALKMLALEQ